MRWSISGVVAVAVCLAAGTQAYGQWSVSTYKGAPTTGEITNYATADALVGGAYLAEGFPVTADYTLANTQDNADAGGPFGLGTQVVGLAEGVDNNDFVFVGTGQLMVDVTGTYEFVTNTDDGSRLLASVNGGDQQQWITDEVLAGPHDVPSGGIALSAGDIIDFEWMWYERGGGAEGEFYYRADTGAGYGANALIGDGSQGLSLVGGSFSGSVYKSVVTPGQLINNFAEGQAVIDTPGSLRGTELRDVINIVGEGSGDADFPGGQGVPGITGQADDYIVVGTGLLVVTDNQAGDYIFRSNTDDGGRLKLDLNQDGDFDDDGELVINQDVLQGPTNTDSAAIALTAGQYPIEYSYFERSGGDEGEVSASVVGGSFILLGDDAAGGLDVIPVPEPTSALLLAMGILAGFAPLRRRHR